MNSREEKKLKILMATPYKAAAGVGGICKWTDNILDYYHSLQAPEVAVGLLPMGRKVLYEDVIRRTWGGIVDYSKIIREERRLLSTGDYDVLHLCTSASVSLLKDLVMLRLAKKYKVHTVVHFHFGRIPELKEKRNWEWKLLRRVVAKADISVPMDKMSFDALSSLGVGKVCYLPNPVGQEVDDYVRSHEKDMQRDERMVLYAGHCIKTKGVYELVHACKDIEGIRLVLAGHVKEEIRQQLEDIANGEPWLEILGRVSHNEVMRLMMQCGIFVLPSYTEGFPNVILESMTCGCAIVATTVGAIPEMIGEENGHQCGLLVAPKDIDALRAALIKLLEDKQLREECQVNARRRVIERYNIASVWQKMVKIWQSANNSIAY